MAEGKGQVALTATASDATREFVSYGSLAPTPSYSKFELQALIEYGASDRFTLIAAPGLQHVNVDGTDGGQRTGLGYSEFGGRYLLLKGAAWVLSTQTTLRLPGTFERANPAAIGYTENETDSRLLLGGNLSAGSWPAFFDVEFAQRFRAGDPPSEFRADFTLGIRPAPRWQLLAQSFNVISEGAGAPEFPSYGYHKLQLSAVYEMASTWALQVGGFSTFTGRHALQENGAVFGVTHKF